MGNTDWIDRNEYPFAPHHFQTAAGKLHYVIVSSTPRLAQLWSKVSVLRDKPALFVWGMMDVAVREKELLRWQDAFPNSQTVRLATVGHFVQEEAPEELAKAVAAFLVKSN
jgi:haloalkane dehalogenase